MMSTKKLSEIREQMLRAMAAKEQALTRWLDEEFSKLSRKRRADPRLYEELNWVREALAQAVKQKKANSRKSKPKVPKAS